MSTTPLIVCPVCNETGLRHLPMHLKNIHKLTGEERKEMLKNAKYILPAAAAETSSSATNTNFVKEESYPCTSEECGKDSHLQEWLKKHAQFHDQDQWEKCQKKRKRPKKEHESALKEVNKALRWFTKTVHCGDAPYTRCYEYNDFKRHVNFMLQ